MLVAFVLALGLGAQPQPTTIAEMWDAWCARCHAKDGTGNVAEPTVKVVPMDFTDCRVTTPEPDADWGLAIAQGGPAVGLSSEMPAFGDSITPEQVRGFVSHIRGFCRERRWPAGNMNLPRPIFTEKAFPENEFVLVPAISHDSGEVEAIFERRIGKRGMWEVVLPISNDGIDEVELSAKYVLHASDAGIFSAGLEVVAPTAVIEPFLAAGTVVGGNYLQAHIKYEIPARPEKAEHAFVYNLYVGRDTSIFPTTWTLGVELNGENRELALTPQLRKGLTRTGALGASIGVQIPLNERQERSTRVVGYLLWEYQEPVRARP